MNIILSENDFHQADAQFILDNKDDFVTIMRNCPSIQSIIVTLIFSIVLKLTQLTKNIMFMIHNSQTVLTDDTIKQVLAQIKSDPKIITRLENIAKELLSTTNTSNANNIDLTINAQPGGNFYRLVTYYKAYNPPARQYLIFRAFNKSTNKYHIAVEGTPRVSNWSTEPLFDSIQQAENFAKNAVNIKTVKDMTKFKYSIISTPLSNGVGDLSNCTLVDTEIGPAYIQNNCQYKEGLAMKNENNELTEATLDPYEQEKKMDAWYNRTRGANIASMSDAKLQMNFDICVRKGYTSQALSLKDEARRRGLAWAQNANIQNNQPQNNAQNPVIFPFDINDFNILDATTIYKYKDDPQQVLNFAVTKKITIVFLAIAIVLKCNKVVDYLKQTLLNGVLTADDLKQNLNTISTNIDIVNWLEKIRKLILHESLNEDIEKHNELNPKLFENKKLKDEVREKIISIVEEFINGLKDKEIKYKLDDIKLVGSNCSYNYNKNSDLDVHLVFDLDIYNDSEKQEMAEIIYDYARGNWNKNHDIYFYDIPVEIFVETNNTEQLN